jgi:predicted RNA-binding Zn-ribbon protein involved in translation (DUF1610 family)
MLVQCESCGARGNVKSEDPTKAFKCPKCGGAMRAAAMQRDAAAQQDAATQRAAPTEPAPTPEQAAPARPRSSRLAAARAGSRRARKTKPTTEGDTTASPVLVRIARIACIIQLLMLAGWAHQSFASGKVGWQTFVGLGVLAATGIVGIIAIMRRKAALVMTATVLNCATAAYYAWGLMAVMGIFSRVPFFRPKGSMMVLVYAMFLGIIVPSVANTILLILLSERRKRSVIVAAATVLIAAAGVVAASFVGGPTATDGIVVKAKTLDNTFGSSGGSCVVFRQGMSISGSLAGCVARFVDAKQKDIYCGKPIPDVKLSLSFRFSEVPEGWPEKANTALQTGVWRTTFRKAFDAWLAREYDLEVVWAERPEPKLILEMDGTEPTGLKKVPTKSESLVAYPNEGVWSVQGGSTTIGRWLKKVSKVTHWQVEDKTGLPRDQAWYYLRAEIPRPWPADVERCPLKDTNVYLRKGETRGDGWVVRKAGSPAPAKTPPPPKPKSAKQGAR